MKNGWTKEGILTNTIALMMKKKVSTVFWEIAKALIVLWEASGWMERLSPIRLEATVLQSNVRLFTLKKQNQKSKDCTITSTSSF